MPLSSAVNNNEFGQQFSISPFEAKLLNMIQEDFPLERRPYLEMARTLGCSEDELIKIVLSLKDRGIIREIGAVFDLEKIGIHSSLVAMKVPLARLDEVAALVGSFPEVTHNYSRAHEFNLWFTPVAGSSDRIDLLLDEIARTTGIKEIYSLPAIRRFKIRVKFHASDEGRKICASCGVVESPDPSAEAISPTSLSSFEKKVIEVLKAGLAVRPFPFNEPAEGAGCSEEDLLNAVARLKKCGVIRRFGARLSHHLLGGIANCMVVWRVPAEDLQRCAAVMIMDPAVSHCYERPGLPGFPFNLYTMIHGGSRTEIEDKVSALAKDLGIKEFEMLFTVKEYKKKSPELFSA